MGQHVFQHAEIHFGLAGAGDPGQQPGGKLLIFASDRPDGGGLFGIQPQPLAEHRKVGAPVRRGRDLSAQIDQPFGAQRLQGAFRQLKLADLMAIDRALQQRRQRLLLFRRAFQAFGRRGAPLFGGEPLPQRRGLGRFALAQQDRQRVEQHFADGIVVVIAGPAQDAPQAGGEQRFRVDHAVDRFEFVQRQFAGVVAAGDDADCMLPAPGHAHARAGHRLHAGRQQIVEGAGEGDRQSNVYDGHDLIQIEKSGHQFTRRIGKCTVPIARPD